ncbi:penicillin-binding protein 2 [Nonomuraea sp. NN258]|uniref:penicillin-binding transpeptidase domain-containing protein n=1 Tax=Nonomuraea antri TaxID=2730852 RepID=UPI001568A7C2|nr:penicillin-binding transpeptidase domain-containing protein [Nonomuraea antri]NRQ33280.1 penicillin-binding protein 2 [Nonomuraea antri]
MAGPRAKRINIPLRRVAMLCAVLLFTLLAHVTVIQAFGSYRLNADQRNQRMVIARFDRPRGDILTYDGTVIAGSRATRSGPYLYQRVYRGGEVYAPITGHVSLYRSTGIERAEDAVLSGDDAKVKVRSLVRDGTAEGADVRLTIDERVQWAAYRALKATGRPGAVVAIHPVTGAILALASYPAYDPNALTTFDAKALAAGLDRLRQAPDRPLFNRALHGLYPPGATFKLVTAAAALASGEYTPTATVDAPSRLNLPGSLTYVQNADAAPCGNAHPSLTYAFQLSCNTAFANLGLQLGQDLLRDQAEAFGFNAGGLTVPLASSPSTYPKELDRPQTALSAIGLHENRATPLMIAMLSAAVANKGVLMRPYLVEEVRLPDGSIINRASPSPYRDAVPEQLAGQLAFMMTTVTRAGGTGAAAALPGVEVAAATATAGSIPGAEDNALVTAFAPADAPEVAVGVVLERPGAGAGAATAVARAVMAAALT